MSKTFVQTAGVLAALMTSGAALADIANIGSATYLGSTYSLLYETGNLGAGNSNGLIWLDYTATGDFYDLQSWAAGLGSALTLNLKPGYSIAWQGSAWHLPSASDSELSGGSNAATTSEFEWLYVKDGLGGFVNLATGNGANWYALNANWHGDWRYNWAIDAASSSQSSSAGDQTMAYAFAPLYGAAVLDATVTSGAVPEPSTWALMLCGFAGAGFAGYRRQREVRAA
jgi:hypothetical protein